jgi:hypothetical protein
MRTADLRKLRDRIAGLARKSEVGERLRNVTVEPDDYGEGTAYLRIEIQLADLENVKSTQVEPLVESIEDVVSKVDDRFPSVRFAEAA